MGRMMVEIPIPPKWKQLWDTWDLRCFIVLSLLLQTFLIFAAPLRKRTNRIWIITPLWSAYLLADQTANFAVGLISNSMGNTNDLSVKKGDRIPVENEDLLAFWAPFLLVHLGGPDTITAFALEDNELWLRHLLGLVFQCIAAVYVFVQSLPHNRLWIPTMLMFMTGIMKYSERTRSLYLASADRFKDSMLTQADPGPNYAKIMDEYISKKEANLPTRIQMVPEPDRAAKSANKAKKGNLTELEVVQYGYQFFKTFKGLVVDMIFSRRERNQSRDFFLNRTAKDAFKVVEVELNFIYEVLFTKLPVVFHIFGAISRFFSLATVCAAIILFIFKDKTNFSDADVTITYGLLFGALVLDMTALIMLLFSDWTIISLRESPDDEPVKSPWTTIITALLRLRTEGRLWDTKDTPQKKNNGSKSPQTLSLRFLKRRWSETMSLRFLKRRWSETISTYNLIYYCLYPLPEPWKFVCKTLGLTDFIDGIVYVDPKECTDKLKEFIFLELKSKSELADDLETAKEISSARGDWVLRVEEGWSSLLKYVVDVDYDQSLILWHIATELCHNSELYDYIKLMQKIKDEDKDKPQKIKVDEDIPKIAKSLSDYMLYLLIMQPSMMSAVAGIGQIRFRDTCAEATRFFEDGKGGEQSKIGDITLLEERTRGMDLKQINACKDILNVSTEVPPVTVKGDRSKSLLFDGCILAKELMKIEKEKNLDKWLILSKVWVELLCYGASHSRANTQAAQVSKGGELITIVWLLMTHFGLGDQFQINEGQARAKLIVRT
ncbi:calcium uniporter protein [Tanacetum coccineum]